ncbi:hypothetical protein [Actinoplanes sp. NPDC051859]|uniref:hypothetical protein n=1 Tax=Actinoplanes sp. NPDC051859 TaxID=3363909 RepID=UPI0037B8A1DC
MPTADRDNRSSGLPVRNTVAALEEVIAGVAVAALVACLSGSSCREANLLPLGIPA